MAGSAPSAPLGSGLPPFDGSEEWLERLPIRLEQTARQLLTMASDERTGPAAPEIVRSAIQWVDADVSLLDVIEWLLILEELGFIQLLTVFGAERFVIAPLLRSRNMLETLGKGEREGGGARASAGERGSASAASRPSGARRQPHEPPPRFCPDHMPFGPPADERGRIEDCGYCARAREVRAAVIEDNHRLLKTPISREDHDE